MNNDLNIIIVDQRYAFMKNTRKWILRTFEGIETSDINAKCQEITMSLVTNCHITLTPKVIRIDEDTYQVHMLCTDRDTLDNTAAITMVAAAYEHYADTGNSEIVFDPVPIKTELLNWNLLSQTL